MLSHRKTSNKHRNCYFTAELTAKQFLTGAQPK